MIICRLADGLHAGATARFAQVQHTLPGGSTRAPQAATCYALNQAARACVRPRWLAPKSVRSATKCGMPQDTFVSSCLERRHTHTQQHPSMCVLQPRPSLAQLRRQPPLWIPRLTPRRQARRPWRPACGYRRPARWQVLHCEAVGDCELLGALVQAGAEVERPAGRREERRRRSKRTASFCIDSSCDV